MKSIIYAAFLALAVLPTTSYAQSASPSSDALEACVVRSVNADESVTVARWLFISMSRHPALPQSARPSDADGMQSNRLMGDLINRLIFDRCATETSAAIRDVGQDAALEVVFGTLGEKAMTDLMTDRDVLASVVQLGAYVDVQRLNAISTSP